MREGRNEESQEPVKGQVSEILEDQRHAKTQHLSSLPNLFWNKYKYINM